MGTKAENTEHEKLVKEILINKEYGDFISHHEISGILGLPMDENKYRSSISKANKILIEKGKKLKNRHGLGYVVLEPDRYVDEAELKFKSGTKRAKEALKILVYAPFNLMSNDAQENYKMVEKGIRSAAAMVMGGLTEIKLLNRPKLIIK
jgi:hypothetical protein